MTTRYTITGSDLDFDSVLSTGATNIKDLSKVGIILADLDAPQLAALRNRGFSVLPVERVQHNPEGNPTHLVSVMDNIKPQDVVAPTQPKINTMFWPEQLINIASINLLHAYSGKGINIAIVDTGIRSTHQKIGNKIIFKKNYTTDEDIDGYDHGTGTADIILTIVPDVGILDLKVMDTLGNGSTEEIIEAIDDCIRFQEEDPAIAPAIINICAGADDDGNVDDPLRIACRAAIENGIWISAAAGNGGPKSGSILSPACERYVFATGSLDEDTPTSISAFSSRGPTKEGLVKPDAVFFGENIIVASSISDTAYDVKSGTSVSAPFSTGIAAKYLEALADNNPANKTIVNGVTNITAQISAEQLIDGGLAPLCVKPLSTDAAEQTGIKDNNYGYGMLDGRLIAQSLKATGVILPAQVSSINGLGGLQTGLLAAAIIPSIMNMMRLKALS